MQALRKTRPEAGLELVDIPAPVPEADSSDVLVKVGATGICGSDLHVDDWTPSYAFITQSLPVTIGHEFVGVAQNGSLRGQRTEIENETYPGYGVITQKYAHEHGSFHRLPI